MALTGALAGCGTSEEVYRGPIFEMRKPSIDWSLVTNPRQFTIGPPLAPEGMPSVLKSKVLEMLHADLRASIEVYFVHDGAERAEDVMKVLQRRAQRQSFRLGEPKPKSVGGRRGTAVIGSWRQRRGAPVQHCYTARVPVGTSLWCFVATVGKANFDEAFPEFQRALESVTFR
jgi:hypothetical protein